MALVSSCNSPWAVPFAGDGCRRGVCPRCNKFVPLWAVPLAGGPFGGGKCPGWIAGTSDGAGVPPGSPVWGGIWPSGCLPERDLASGIPVRWPRGLQKANRCAAHNLFCCPSSPLCKHVCSSPVRAQKKWCPLGIIRFAFERKTGFEPATLSLGSWLHSNSTNLR